MLACEYHLDKADNFSRRRKSTKKSKINKIATKYNMYLFAKYVKICKINLGSFQLE